MDFGSTKRRTPADEPGGWTAHYRDAIEAGRSWVDLLRRGDHLFVGSASGEPTALVSDLVDAIRGRAAPSPLTAFQMPAHDSPRLLEAAGADLRFVGLFYHPEIGRDEGGRNASFLPIGIYQIASSISNRSLRFDVALVHGSPPDAHGYMSLGLSADFAIQAVRSARTVVVEVNDRAPRVHGHSFVHVSEIAAVVESSRPPTEFPAPTADAESLAIGDHVAEWVPDGATVEIGIGAVMSGVAARLANRRDLGIHTGLVTDFLVDLMEAGAITNASKGIDFGVTVANQCRGTARLYSLLDDNPAISIRPALYTHDPRVLGSLRTFRAINSALQVDLLGRANTEFIGTRRVSGAGGVVDFARACHVTEDGRSIIAIRSTVGEGRRTRIVAALDGRGATLTADLADVVVTEHGAVDLRGMDAEKRVNAMISIADPRFRDELARASRAASVARP